MNRRRRLIIGAAVVVGLLVYLAATGLRSSSYYVTVSELKAKGPSDRVVRVAGKVVEGSIRWDSRTMTLTFEITDEGDRLPVVYHGPRPDMLRDGAEVVVEGRYTEEGIFTVNPRGLFLKCPSRYQEEGD